MAQFFRFFFFFPIFRTRVPINLPIESCMAFAATALMGGTDLCLCVCAACAFRVCLEGDVCECVCRCATVHRSSESHSVRSVEVEQRVDVLCGGGEGGSRGSFHGALEGPKRLLFHAGWRLAAGGDVGSGVMIVRQGGGGGAEPAS